MTFTNEDAADAPQPPKSLDLKKGLAVIKRVIQENKEWLKEMARR